MTDFRFICVRFMLFILDFKILSVTERHTKQIINSFVAINILTFGSKQSWIFFTEVILWTE